MASEHFELDQIQGKIGASMAWHPELKKRHGPIVEKWVDNMGNQQIVQYEDGTREAWPLNQVVEAQYNVSTHNEYYRSILNEWEAQEHKKRALEAKRILMSEQGTVNPFSKTSTTNTKAPAPKTAVQKLDDLLEQRLARGRTAIASVV